jgi:catechol 2,3-dioxygenase-like lactoylglutathione lyase family enzyme
LIDAQRVDFIAVPVQDLARASAFYGETLGLARHPKSGERWVEYETGNLTLALSTFGGGIAIGVADVDEARRTLEGAGVEFSGDTFDSGVCNGASFADPAGNRLLLHHRYAPLEPWEPPATEVQRADFIGIPVTDRLKAAQFYGETLGLKRNELSSDKWPEFEPGNVAVLLNTPEQTGDTFGPSNFAVSLRVPDVARAMEELQAKGVEFRFPEAYDSGVCHMAFFNDPDGNALILHHRYAPYRDGSKP